MSSLKITIEITTVEQLVQLRDALELHYDMQCSEIDDLTRAARHPDTERQQGESRETLRKLSSSREATHALRLAIDPEWTPKK